MTNKSRTIYTSNAYRAVMLKAKEHMDIIDISKNQPEQLPPALEKNYEIDTRFGNNGYASMDTGAKAVALRHKTEDKVIIAYAPLALDWREKFVDIYNVHDGGAKQWASLKPAVNNYQNNLPQTTQIEKVGHSLGAAVAAQSGHDDMAPDSPFKGRVKVYGYDSVGAADNMKDPSRLDGVMSNLLIAGNDFHTANGAHTGSISSIPPSDRDSDKSSHSAEGIKKSISDVMENNGKGFEEDYRPKYRQDTASGSIGKVLSNPAETTRRGIDKIKAIPIFLKQKIGRAGEVMTELGSMSFDAASSVGKDALAHTVVQAVSYGGAEGKAVLSNAARAAMGQMLGRMHGEVVREISIQHPLGTPGFNPHANMPSGPPEAPTRKAIEATINDPRNAGGFDKVATKVAAILKNVEGADPSAVLVAKVLEELRGGSIKVQPHILVPDLFPQEGSPTKPTQQPLEEVGKQKTSGKKLIEIGGLKIAIKIPEIEYQTTPPIVADPIKSLMPGENKLPPVVMNGGIKIGHEIASRGDNGKVHVRAYTRADGTQVAAHTRTEADGIPTNNLNKK